MAWILVCMLRTYKTFNPTMKILKYEFNNELLDDIILLRVISCVIWILKNYKKKKSKCHTKYS